MRGYHAEGRRWLEEAFARAPDADPAARTRALIAAGPVLMLQGEFARARTVLREGLALAGQRRDLTDIARAHMYLGLCAVLTGELAEGTRQLHEVLSHWEAVGDPFGLGLTRFYLGYAADAAGDAAAAAAYYSDSLQWMDTVGDAQFAGVVHCYLAVAEWQRGELSRAAAQVRAAVRTCVTLKNRHLLSFAAQTAVALVGARADPAGRACLLGAADALARTTGATFVWDRMPGRQDVEKLRERLELEGWGEAYREGRTLPFHEVAGLALRLLEEVAQASASPEAVRQPSQKARRSVSQSGAYGPLSAREREVLQLVVQGHSNKAIGRELSFSDRTVAQHLNAVFDKLGVISRAQAIAVATQRGLL